jgi:hypothetical protein
LDISVYTIDFINQNLGFCGGYIGFFKTTNGGYTWNNVTLPVYMVPTDIFFINNQTGWVIGYGEGAILKTTDAGQSWVIQHSFPTYGAGLPRRLFFIDSLNGWATTGKPELGNVLQTTDGGDNWNIVDLPTYNVMNDLWFINRDKGWILGTLGNIFCNDSSIIVSSDEIKSKPIPSRIEISQNYPNPFNPITKIKYRIADFGFVSLKVYDILGREIAALVNEEKSAGNYKVQFDASEIPNGVYFYQLKAGNYIETKKMVLMK